MYLLGYIPSTYWATSLKTTVCTSETVLLILLSLFQSDVPIGLHPQRQPSVPRRQSFSYYCLYFRVMYLLGYIPKDNRLYLGDSPYILLSLFQSDVPIGLHPQRQPSVPRRQGAQRDQLLPAALGPRVPDSRDEAGL